MWLVPRQSWPCWRPAWSVSSLELLHALAQHRCSTLPLTWRSVCVQCQAYHGMQHSVRVLGAAMHQMGELWRPHQAGSTLPSMACQPCCKIMLPVCTAIMLMLFEHAGRSATGNTALH